MKRVFLIVLDSFGIGETEDAASCGDVNVNTLGTVSSSPFFSMTAGSLNSHVRPWNRARKPGHQGDIHGHRGHCAALLWHRACLCGSVRASAREDGCVTPP